MLLSATIALVATPILAPQDDTSAESANPGPPEESLPDEARPAEETPTGPRTTTTADWQKWERLGSTVLSPDGRWVAYSISRNDGTSELRARVVATDATEVFEQGGRPTFSRDAKWLAFSITKSEAEREKLEKAKKPIESDLGLFDLVRGERDDVEGVRSFSFSGDGHFLAMLRHGERGDEHGSDLVVRNLATGVDTHFGRVGSHSWSDEGAWLAMTVDAPDKAGNAVRVLDAATGVLRTLDSADEEYASLRWREDAADLAALRKAEYEDDEDATYTVLAWRGLDRKEPRATVYDHLADDAFPADLRVVAHDGVRWSEDGEQLYFGLQPWDERPAALDEDESDDGEGDATKGDDADDDEAEEGEDAPPAKEGSKKDGEDEAAAARTLRESLDEAPGVEIWHARDIDIVPRQKRTASSDERESDLAVLRLDAGTVTRLEDEIIERATVLKGERRAIGRDETPYETEQRFSATVFDVYSIDTRTGERQKVIDRIKYVLTGDPRGRHVVFVRDDRVWAYDLERKSEVELAAAAETSFVNREVSSLTDQKPLYGLAAWSQKGDVVYLYDRYDIWSVPIDGSAAQRLTEGAVERVRHRRVVVAADPDEEEFVDPRVGFHVSLYGDVTKQSGYGRLVPGRGVERLVVRDARLSGLRRAEDADVFTYTQQRFDDSPDVHVGGPRLVDAKEVSRTNPQAEEFAWGRAELVDYENVHGEALQGALFYPANYDESKTYPMIVYIYELRSQSLHQYQSPSETSPYNTSVFTQDGYFVFQPDIVYRAQNPGLSAVECVVPAVRKVLESGRIDPERVGLVGHSWGAYQTAFIVTQTDLFAAGVAGAPLTNMMSMSMSIYWNSGQTDAHIFHESQGRMDRPFWRDVDTYIANSPIFSIENLRTPLLVAFGDEDGAVDWQQGIEMYNAARLAQRPFVMLVYPGENHGLREEPNQVDYHHRVREWFGTHLKGEEKPRWISDGIPWLEQKEALDAIGKKDGRKSRDETSGER